MLEEARVAGGRVDLFGATRGETVLGEYAGEARIIQDPDPEEVAGHAVVYICEHGAAATTILETQGTDNLVIDLTGSEAAERRGSVVHLDLLPPPDTPNGGVGMFSVPHFLSIALAEILDPVQAGPGLRDATAVVLLPAADLGDAGVEELRRQTVNLLNFTTLPVDVFGRQLAFNVIPESLVPDEGPPLSSRIEREVARLLRQDRPRLAARVALVPVFFGHGVMIRVVPGQEVSVSDVEKLLGAARGLEVGCAEPTTTPVESGGSRRSLVSEISTDGTGGVWIWAVLEDAGLASARQAVRLAGALSDPGS
jgi:hypothetical protein